MGKDPPPSCLLSAELMLCSGDGVLLRTVVPPTGASVQRRLPHCHARRVAPLLSPAGTAVKRRRELLPVQRGQPTPRINYYRHIGGGPIPAAGLACTGSITTDTSAEGLSQQLGWPLPDQLLPTHRRRTYPSIWASLYQINHFRCIQRGFNPTARVACTESIICR